MSGACLRRRGGSGEPDLRPQPGKESATYRDLRIVRSGLPWHTLLQYTATPQAVLLISIADEISPEFTCVLAAGQDYVGGKYFFEDRRDSFVRVISQSEFDASGLEIEPPDTLFEALATSRWRRGWTGRQGGSRDAAFDADLSVARNVSARALREVGSDGGGPMGDDA